MDICDQKEKLGKQAKKCFCEYFKKSTALESTLIFPAPCCWARSYMLHFIGFMKDTTLSVLRLRSALKKYKINPNKINEWIINIT